MLWRALARKIRCLSFVRGRLSAPRGVGFVAVIPGRQVDLGDAAALR